MAALADAAKVSVRSTIVSLLQQVAAEHGRTLAPLTDELKIFESGLDSLSVAIVVMRLAELLGNDPFDNGSAVKHPMTFGDFVRMYETALAANDRRAQAARFGAGPSRSG